MSSETHKSSKIAAKAPSTTTTALDTEISELEKEIATLGPTIHPHPEEHGLPPGYTMVSREKMELQRTLGEKKEARFALLEEARVAEVVEAHGHYPDPYDTDPDNHDRECPLCQKAMPLWVIPTTTKYESLQYYGVRQACCGKRICDDCEKIRDMHRSLEASKTGERISKDKKKNSGRDVATMMQALDIDPMSEVARGGLRILKCECCNFVPMSEDQIERSWYSHAQQGKTWAQIELASQYVRGATKADASKGAAWFRKAAEKGNVQAQFMLGMLYYEGTGIRKSKQEAKHWLEVAASVGHRPAQRVLGAILLQDDASKEDEAMAFQWFTLAAAQESCGSMNHLGNIYESGKGVSEPCNYRALYWYRKAAELGNAEAYMRLSITLMGVHESRSDDYIGYAYSTGFSILPEGLYWARKALESGEDERARELVKRMERLCHFDTCAECSATTQDLGRALSQCSGCQAVAYCGAKCQKANWKEGHRRDCYRGTGN